MDEMKTNFIVSVYKKSWILGAKKLFLTEPFVHHYLEKNNELKNYSEVNVASHLRQTKNELVNDHEFVDHKYQKYIPILAKRLNEIHHTDYEVAFWQKSLSLSLIRNITFIFDMFQNCQKYFNDRSYDCQVLSPQSYYIPIDFNDHRNFFQSTAYGQEQMFSIYINLFYPSKFQLVNDSFFWPIVPQSKEENRALFFLRKIGRITKVKLQLKITEFLYKSKKPTLVVFESFFSPRNLLNLIRTSKGAIQRFPVRNELGVTSISTAKRNVLSNIDPDFDEFDRYFFTSLQYCFPKLFIEGFESIYKQYFDLFEKHKSLKYVVNESWIGNNYSSIGVAFLQQRGVQHICNEHNYLSHPFLGNNNKYIYPLVDKFLTLGWINRNIPNMIKGSSLYEWTLNKGLKKEHSILFIAGQPPVKVPEISACYGDFGSFNAVEHLKFTRDFFQALDRDTVKTMVYRGYPVNAFSISYLEYPMVAYDQEFILKDFLKKVDFIDNTSPSGKELMLKSRLVVIDYLSTSYLESMKADIPTVFFWNTQTYFLDNQYLDFYDCLVEAGICQTDPVRAAQFIEEIKDNPEGWWSQEKVQTAKNKFLEANFGEPSVMLNYLTNLVSGNND